MNVVTMLALFCLFVLCGALARRFAGSTASCLTPGDAEDTAGRLDALADAYERLETDLHQRVTELEERLDFTERVLARQETFSRRSAMAPDSSPRGRVLSVPTDGG